KSPVGLAQAATTSSSASGNSRPINPLATLALAARRRGGRLVGRLRLGMPLIADPRENQDLRLRRPPGFASGAGLFPALELNELAHILSVAKQGDAFSPFETLGNG